MKTSKIKKIRRDLGLTQAEFAHAIGVTPSTVSRWERGKTGEVSRLATKSIQNLIERKK